MKDGPVCVAAHLHGTGGLTLVHERVHIPHDRVRHFLTGLHQNIDRADVGHLVHRRRERNRRARHLRDARTPHAARDHHVLSLDATLIGDDGAHGAVRDLHVEHFGVREDLEMPRVGGFLAHERAGAQRVDD